MSRSKTPNSLGKSSAAVDRVKVTAGAAVREASQAVREVVTDPAVREIVGTQARALLSRSLFGGSFVGIVAARVATKSVPGALLVGSVLAARAIHKHRKARLAEQQANTDPANPPEAMSPPKSS